MAKKKSRTTTKGRLPKKRRHVKVNYKDIYINPDCTVDPPDTPYPPYVKYGDQVKWHSRGGNFAIVFQPNPPNPYVSPWDTATVFHVKSHGVTNPGAIKIKQDLVYKYRVVGDNGCDIDPKIRIGP